MNTLRRSLTFQLAILSLFLAGIAAGFLSDISSTYSTLYTVFLVLTGLSAALGLTRVTLVRSYLSSLTTQGSETARLALRRITQSIVTVAALLSLLWLIDVNVAEVLTALSIVAVAFVLVFKEYITNFIATVYLLLTGRVGLGDYVDTGTHSGTVQEITFQTVILRSLNGNQAVVPSISLITAGYTRSNGDQPYTYESKPLIDLSSYDEIDLDALTAVINDTEKVKHSSCYVSNTQKDSVELTLSATSKDPGDARDAVNNGLDRLAKQLSNKAKQAKETSEQAP